MSGISSSQPSVFGIPKQSAMTKSSYDTFDPLGLLKRENPDNSLTESQ